MKNYMSPELILMTLKSEDILTVSNGGTNGRERVVAYNELFPDGIDS